MSKKHIDDIFVFYKDNTYKTIRPENDIIIQTASKKNVKYLLFPINSKSGTKYYKEEPSNIISNIKIHITGVFTILNFTADGVYTTDEVQIDMKSKNIVDSYNLIGNLLDTQLCFDSINSSSMTTSADFSLCPAMLDFDIKIYSDGQDYHLTPDVFASIIDRSDSAYYGIDLLSDFNEPVILFDELIRYIEHTVFFKDKYTNLDHQNKDYIIYPDGTYEILSFDEDIRKHIHKPIEIYTNAAVLISTTTAEYVVASLQEFDTVHTESMYTITYTIYDKEVSPTINDISEEEITSVVLNELDGYDFEVLWEDNLYIYSIKEFIFVMISLKELSELLIKSLANWEPNCASICFTISANYRYDDYHSFSVNEHATSKMINNGYDLLYNMVRYIRYNKRRYKLGEIL